MSVAACPACSGAGPVAESVAGRDTPTHHLVLPNIHCASCIRTVEDTLRAQPGIRDARVNLTLKRAAITAAPNADPTPWITALARAGHEAYEADAAPDRDAAGRDLILRLGVAGFAMMNVMLLSVAVWSGAADATRDLFHWISALIALPAALFAAQPFFRNAWSALKSARLNMDVPISLAILLACGMSLYETMEGGDHAYFDAALSLTFFLLAGRVLDARMRRAARSAAHDLAALEPSRVTRIEEGVRMNRPLIDVAAGDVLWLPAGARLPVDAELLDDSARIDRSLVTGESDPVTRFRGAGLVAGDVTLTGPITVRATAVGEDTTLRRMARLVAVAEAARTRYTGLADRAAAIYAPAVHLIAFAAFVGWTWATGDVRHALNVAVATLIITCPCALGLAVPAVATAATGALFRRGMLVTSDTALERLASIDTVVFDKTGTLTRATLTPPSDLPTDVEGVLAALAAASEHPLSRSLATVLEGVARAELSQVREEAGRGIHALWSGEPVFLGRDDGGETVFCSGDRRWSLERSESLLPDARAMIDTLRDRGLDVRILTGDRADKAARTAEALGVATVEAEMTPDRKQTYVAALQAEGRKVLMVGDGLNDTAALAAADASIAPGTALEASRNAADVILTGPGLSRIGDALSMAKASRSRILENFGLAAAYNVVAIPLALAGLATPLLAALAMSTSSVTVILNALRVRRA